MAIVAKTYLDNVVVQFASGAEHQLAKPGEIEGAHFAEIEYLVDDATWAIVGKSNNPMNGRAQVLDPAKVADVLGAQFAAVAAQLAATQAAAGQAKLDHEAQLGAVQAALAQVKADHGKAIDDLAARDAQILQIEVALKAANERAAAMLASVAKPDASAT